MAVTIYQGYSPSTQEPIDDRLVLASQQARYDHPWFETFQGMLVYQVDNAQLWAYSGSNPTPIVAPNSNAGPVSYVVQMTDGTNTCYDTIVINTPGALINIDTVVNFICGNDGYVTVSDIGGASTNPLNFVQSLI